MQPALTNWETFYVIVGAAAASLIGLQFVAMALAANLQRRADPETLGAYATPNVIHLAAVLLVAAIVSAPWTALLGPSIALGLTGLAGLVHCAMVVGRARRQSGYEPVWEDWLWYTVLPCSAYAALALAAIFLKTASQTAPFIIGGAALGLLFVGIHNAWDAVTYIVTSGLGDSTQEE